MKYIFLSICIIISIILTGLSCKKTVTKDPLPPATQTGANTMGCYVNGKPWLPNTEPFGSIPELKAISVSFWNTQDQLYFRFYRSRKPDNQSLIFYIKDFNGVGEYKFELPSKIMGVPGSYGILNNYFYFVDANAKKEFVTNANYQGTVNITFYDSTSRVVSGTFEFKGQDYSGSPDSIVVTNGRFDCKMN